MRAAQAALMLCAASAERRVEPDGPMNSDWLEPMHVLYP
jgi:hypothetical protein